MSSSTSAAFTPLMAPPAPELAVVVGGDAVTGVLDAPELRSGEWTRFGPASLLGDETTESAVSTLVEDARAAARSQGYAVGWAEGRREAAAEATLATRARDREVADERRRWATRQETAIAALQQAAAGLARLSDETQARVQTQAIELARELTEIMVGHELRSSPDNSADVVARVLAACPADRPFVVRLHPEVVDSAAAHALPASGVRVVSDAGLDPADAVVELDGQILDLRLRSALDRIREVLS
jgi:flagellar assembly protein FliH